MRLFVAKLGSSQVRQVLVGLFYLIIFLAVASAPCNSKKDTEIHQPNENLTDLTAPELSHKKAHQASLLIFIRVATPPKDRVSSRDSPEWRKRIKRPEAIPASRTQTSKDQSVSRRTTAIPSSASVRMRLLLPTRLPPAPNSFHCQQ